jgi:hypothetical protein
VSVLAWIATVVLSCAAVLWLALPVYIVVAGFIDDRRWRRAMREIARHRVLSERMRERWAAERGRRKRPKVAEEEEP